MPRGNNHDGSIAKTNVIEYNKGLSLTENLVV